MNIRDSFLKFLSRAESIFKMITEIDIVEDYLFRKKEIFVVKETCKGKTLFHVAHNQGIYSIDDLNNYLNYLSGSIEFVLASPVKRRCYTVTPQGNVRFGSITLSCMVKGKEQVLEIILYPDSRFRYLVLESECYKEYIPGWRLRWYCFFSKMAAKLL